MNNTDQFSNDFEKRFIQMSEDLKDESDRAVVIIISAHFDNLLKELLTSALVPSSQSTDSLFSGVNAPLHSFSNKIDFSYRLGLTSEFLSRSLHLIRKIRNEFAHNITGCTLENNGVRSRVEEIYKLHRYDEKETMLKEIFESTTTKSKLLLSSILILGLLSEAIHNLSSIKSRDPEWLFSWLLK